MIGIVGLGLMGGSIARVLAKRGQSPIVIEPDPDVRSAAAGLAELHAAPNDALERCDLVVLAAPLRGILAALGPVSRAMRDGALLTDVAGVKGRVVAAAREEVRPGVHFVGSHPMFGGVAGGFAASSAELVSGVAAVCDDFAEARAVDGVCAFWEEIGVRVMRCSADAHDRAMAEVSHLPYVLACLLAQKQHPLAGRGFADATRLARFSFDVQGEVARSNPHLIAAIDDLVARLQTARDALADDAPDGFRRALRGE